MANFDTKRLLLNANSQRESCRRQVEMLSRELEEVKNQAESKIRECVALVDEQEYLAREPENAEEYIIKLRDRVKMEQTLRKDIQRRLEAINAQSPFSCPPNNNELLFLPQWAKTTTILKHFKTLSFRTNVVGRTFSILFCW